MASFGCHVLTKDWSLLGDFLVRGLGLEGPKCKPEDQANICRLLPSSDRVFTSSMNPIARRLLPPPPDSTAHVNPRCRRCIFRMDRVLWICGGGGGGCGSGRPYLIGSSLEASLLRPSPDLKPFWDTRSPRLRGESFGLSFRLKCIRGGHISSPSQRGDGRGLSIRCQGLGSPGVGVLMARTTTVPGSTTALAFRTRSCLSSSSAASSAAFCLGGGGGGAGGGGRRGGGRPSKLTLLDLIFSVQVLGVGVSGAGLRRGRFCFLAQLGVP